jgi:hypothetical protein
MPQKHTAITTDTTKGTVRPHQPGQAVFRAILSEDIDWKPFAAFPPLARLAILVGQPSEPGPYVIRVKVPGGVKLMPHTHPEDRISSTLSFPASSTSAWVLSSTPTSWRPIRRGSDSTRIAMSFVTI